MILYFVLFLIGLLGGFISGLIGVGGGLIYIVFLPPILLQLGVPSEEIAQYTIANSLLGTFFAAGFSTFNHARNKEFYGKAVFLIAAFGIVTSLLSLYFIVNTSFYSKELFNIVVIVLLLVMLLNTYWNAKRQQGFTEKKTQTKRIYAFTGSAAGVVAALTGLGGGIIIVPVTNQLLKTGVRKAKTISLGVITITSFIMVLYNLMEEVRISHDVFHVGYIVFQVVLPIVAGTLISASWGVKASRKFPQHIISYLFAGFVMLVVIKKLLELIP